MEDWCRSAISKMRDGACHCVVDFSEALAMRLNDRKKACGALCRSSMFIDIGAEGADCSVERNESCFIIKVSSRDHVT